MRTFCIGFLLATILCLAPGCDEHNYLRDGQELHWVDNRIIKRAGDVYTIYLDSSIGVVQFETDAAGASHIKYVKNLWVVVTLRPDEDSDSYAIFGQRDGKFKQVELDLYN